MKTYITLEINAKEKDVIIDALGGFISYLDREIIKNPPFKDELENQSKLASHLHDKLCYI